MFQDWRLSVRERDAAFAEQKATLDGFRKRPRDINRESVANVQRLALFPGKPITDAADGFDEVGGVSEFFAEGADVNIDRAFQGIGVLTA